MAIIRLASGEDAASIAAIYGPYCESTPVSFETVAPRPDDMEHRIRTITAQFPWLVLVDAQIAGYAYATRHRDRAAYGWSVDTAVYVSPTFRRRGVGRALYTALFQLLQRQGYFKAYAGITIPNAASIALHQAVGFKLVGVYEKVGYKLGAWHDVAWYHLTLQPERLGPELPRPLSSLEASEWQDAVSAGLREYRSAD